MFFHWKLHYEYVNFFSAAQSISDQFILSSKRHLHVSSCTVKPWDRPCLCTRWKIGSASQCTGNITMSVQGYWFQRIPWRECQSNTEIRNHAHARIKPIQNLQESIYIFGWWVESNRKAKQPQWEHFACAICIPSILNHKLKCISVGVFWHKQSRIFWTST